MTHAKYVKSDPIRHRPREVLIPATLPDWLHVRCSIVCRLYGERLPRPALFATCSFVARAAVLRLTDSRRQQRRPNGVSDTERSVQCSRVLDSSAGNLYFCLCVPADGQLCHLLTEHQSTTVKQVGNK